MIISETSEQEEPSLSKIVYMFKDSMNYVCKECGTNLDGGDIYEYFFAKYADKNKALRSARVYGWKETDRVRFHNSIVIQPDKGEQYSICSKCKTVLPKNDAY
jgi:hypothetical protein